MARFLESINPAWKDGHGVALLTESNTAFGRNAGHAAKDVQDEKDEQSGTRLLTAEHENTPPGPFANAKFFSFPMHIAQLRSDAPALAQPGALLSGPVIPLNMRETVPPSDLIPALRPQLTSPVVESTVDSILDAIRHEKLSAVGILATDDRDVLFLSREVKRASPDVQLFLFGTHGLYLHPDYVPYLRGALVASSYALTLANQPEVAKSSDPQHRQPFPSMVAEGIFYATRALLSLTPEASGSKPYSARLLPRWSDRHHELRPGRTCVHQCHRRGWLLDNHGGDADAPCMGPSIRIRLRHRQSSTWRSFPGCRCNSRSARCSCWPSSRSISSSSTASSEPSRKGPRIRHSWNCRSCGCSCLRLHLTGLRVFTGSRFVSAWGCSRSLPPGSRPSRCRSWCGARV